MRVGVQNRKLWVWIGVGAVVVVGLLFVRTMAKRQEAQCDEAMAGLQTALERGDRAQVQQHLDRAAAVCQTLRKRERAQIAESIAADDRAAAAKQAEAARAAAAARQIDDAVRRFPTERAQLVAEVADLERFTTGNDFDVAAARTRRDALAAKLDLLRRSSIAGSPEAAPLLRRADGASKRIDELEAKKRADQAALDQRCGEQPLRGDLDVEVQTYLLGVLKDPDSLQDLVCSTFEMTRDRCWATTCTFRAKNSFGGYTRERYRFYKSRVAVTHERLRL